MLTIEKDTAPWDAAEFLDTEEAQAEFLTAALEGGDPTFFTHALGVVARARGMSQIAKDTGLGRQNLYKALGGAGNPEIATVFRVLQALGIRLEAKTKGPSEAASMVGAQPQP